MRRSADYSARRVFFDRTSLVQCQHAPFLCPSQSLCQTSSLYRYSTAKSRKAPVKNDEGFLLTASLQTKLLHHDKIRIGDGWHTHQRGELHRCDTTRAIGIVIQASRCRIVDDVLINRRGSHHARTRGKRSG